MTTMTVALGTSTPTSMTVVATRTSSSPAPKRAITSSLTSGGSRPCSAATRSPASGPSCSSGSRSSTATAGRRPSSPGAAGSSSPPIRGQTTKACRPGGGGLADALPGAVDPLRVVGDGHDVGGDRRPPPRQLGEGRDLEVAVHGHRDGARDGGGRHDEHVRGAALRAQGVALLDAEAVLLVDDDEPEVGELHALRQQRVGADDDARLPGRRLEQGPAAGRGAQRAGEQRDPGGDGRAVELARAGERAEHLAQRAGVLLGEHLGGREQRRLAAAVDDGEHRAQRHERLARADLALQQPVHRRAAGELARPAPPRRRAARR